MDAIEKTTPKKSTIQTGNVLDVQGTLEEYVCRFLTPDDPNPRKIAVNLILENWDEKEGVTTSRDYAVTLKNRDAVKFNRFINKSVGFGTELLFKDCAEVEETFSFKNSEGTGTKLKYNASFASGILISDSEFEKINLDEYDLTQSDSDIQ